MDREKTRHVISVIKIFAYLLGFFCCQSCTQEVEVFGSGDPVPVVYCLLNPFETIQYVRVGKSYLVYNKSIDSPPSVDSLVWPVDAEVYMQRWENNGPVETVLFDKIEIFAKDSGFFAVNGLTIYQAEFQPKSGEIYHLFVYFADLDIIVSGETQIMSSPQLLDPAIVPGRTITFDTISPYTVRWMAGDYPGLYQGIFKMNYSESLGNDVEYKSCYFSTPIYYDPGTSVMDEKRLNSQSFFQSVSEQLSPLNGVHRDVINFEFIFYSAGPDLALLVNSEMNVNVFTSVFGFSNISGGIGVFSSRIVQRVPNLVPSVMTKYFLSKSMYTKDLGFLKPGDE